MSLLVSIPTLFRPERVIETARSAREATPDARIHIWVSPEDEQTPEACAASDFDFTVVPWSYTDGADWARKHNRAYREMSEEWILLAGDDLHFHPGWFDAALDAAAAHWNGGACVVGTNDMGNSRVLAGGHSTHPLVHRDYIHCGGVIDAPDKLVPEAYGHWYCNPPEAPIWMADCSFKPLGEVEEGDVVVGWEYGGQRRTVGAPRRTLAYSEVLKVKSRRSDLVRVIMESGREFRCTPDHRWLNAVWMPSSSAGTTQWVTPEVGRALLHVAAEPPIIPLELERLAGWLAGIYDGEGSGIVVATQSLRQNPDVVVAIREALDSLGIAYSEGHVSRDNGVQFVLNGGRQGYLDFLLRMRPIRGDSLAAHILGWRSRTTGRQERAPIGARRFGHLDRVVAVEPAGESEVVSLTTTTGNYVAWGYASRNCDDEFVRTAMARRAYAHAHGALVEHLHPNWGKAQDDETYRIGQASIGEDRLMFEQRRRLWDPRFTQGY